MSSNGDVDFGFDQPKVNSNPNMEDVLDKVDKFSIDWQNFDVPNNQSPRSKSHVSDIFNKSKKSQSQISQRRDFQDSRDIMQISIMANTQSYKQKGSFRFEKQDDRNFPKTNQRYSKLQQLLENAKKNSLQHFYKNIDRQNKAYNQQPDKFVNYKEFREYIKDLKSYKKQNQMPIILKQSLNPFGVNSNKVYQPQMKTSNSNEYINKVQTRNQPKQVAPLPQYNFLKKQTVQSNNNPFSTGNLLPKQFETEGFFDVEQPAHDQKSNPTLKFNNFYQGQKLPQKAEQHNKAEDAFDFFDADQIKNNGKKQKQQKKTLQPIRQEKHNSFQRTFQQEKLDNLFKNYQVMKKNFQQLMGQLKSTNQGQEMLVTELRKLKDQKEQHQIREQRKQRKQKKQKEYQQKNKKLDSIKDEIVKIKTSDKDILYSQINKKIEQLQSVVRSALQQINQQKQAKIVPKVTNYFCDHQKHFQMIDQQFEKGFEQFDPQAYREKQKMQQSRQKQQKQLQHEKSGDIFVEKMQNLQVDSRKYFQQSPNQFSQKQLNPKSQKSSNYRRRQPQHQMFKSASMSGSRASRARQTGFQEFQSPLDLHLQANNSAEYSQSLYIEQDFKPQQFAQQYYPKQFQGYNKNLRNCLIQKSSVVFESFDFHVSARFSTVDDQLHPIVASMRVGNKCSIDLYDVHAILYGPQGPGISTDPSTIFQQQVKKNSSFAFQVALDKSCLEDNGFSIQISYKTDSMSKKKINFKVPLPMIQLIRPQFIYEQKFIHDWQNITNEMFLRPKRLDSHYLRSHEDVKLVLPFIELNQQNPDSFSYGILFRYPKTENSFYLKITCYVSGKASIQLRSQKQTDRKLKQQILNVLNFIFYAQ